MLALAVILAVFLGLGFITLAFALFALCAGFYDEIYGDLEHNEGD